MSQWVLVCPTCGKEFPYSLIVEKASLAQLRLPHKPEFPHSGLALVCSRCGESAMYERHNLIYRFSPAVEENSE
jgi:DNA-directed RNA polymerase subunit RPC12/RpoP